MRKNLLSPTFFLLFALTFTTSIYGQPAPAPAEDTAEVLDVELAQTEAKYAELHKRLTDLGQALLKKMTTLQDVANKHAVTLGVNIMPVPDDEPLPPQPLPDPPLIDTEITLSIPESITGAPSEFIRIVATTNGKRVRYMPIDKGIFAFPSSEILNPKNTVVAAPQPGVYRIWAVTALGSEISEPVKITVTITGASPDPGPGPNPPNPPDPPGPTPVVTAKNLWVVSIDNKLGRTAKIGAVLGNVPFWTSLQAAGHQFEQIDAKDKDGKAALFAPVLAKAGVTAPALIFMDADKPGKVLKTVALPGSTAEIQTVVNQLTGK